MISSGFSLGAENLEERVGTPIRPLPSICQWTELLFLVLVRPRKKFENVDILIASLKIALVLTIFLKNKRLLKISKFIAELIIPWNGQKFSEETFWHLWKTWLHWRSRSFRSLGPRTSRTRRSFVSIQQPECYHTAYAASWEVTSSQPWIVTVKMQSSSNSFHFSVGSYSGPRTSRNPIFNAFV